MEKLDRIPEFPVIHVPDYTPTILAPRTQAQVLAEIAHELRGGFLAGCHGIRPGELRALDVDDVEERELSDGVALGLVVRRAKRGPNAKAVTGSTKTRDASWVPLDEELAEWIAWRLERHAKARAQMTAVQVLTEKRHGFSDPWASPALFPNPGSLRGPNPERRWIANALRAKCWNAAAAPVGVRVKMYEGTKHSSATAWRTDGMSLDMLQRMLRHRDVRSTERYGKLVDHALVEAFRRTPGRGRKKA
jgi:integrase